MGMPTPDRLRNQRPPYQILSWMGVGCHTQSPGWACWRQTGCV